jgi:hypothetical protein
MLVVEVGNDQAFVHPVLVSDMSMSGECAAPVEVQGHL